MIVLKGGTTIMSESFIKPTDIYCSSCGAKLTTKDGHCSSCGKLVGEAQYAGIERIGAAGKGYSENTKHESFARASKATNKGVMIILPIIALVIIVALIVMGVSPIGSIISGVATYILMLILALLNMRKKPSWEGTVEKKTYEKIKRQGADRRTYLIKFKTDDGKTKKQVWHSYSPVWDYLQEGDKVRYVGDIGGVNAFEKYDKSEDESIPCACCGKLMDPRYTYCTICGALLLKGKTS